MEITIRRATPDDAEAFARIFDTPHTLRGTLQVPYTSVEFRRRRLSEADDNLHPLAAVVDGEVVGQLTLHTTARPRRKHAAGLGMAVRDDMQGQGVGTALMQACIDLADNWLNVHRLELEVFVDNEAAIHLYHKFGFVTEGRLVDYGFRDGEYADVFVMGRLRPAESSERQ